MKRKFLIMLYSTQVVSISQALASGKNVDAVADVLTWVVLFVIPVVGLTVFWKLHIFPEKVAEQRNHPQKDAIQALCILSLFIGGMLWPLALVWAYSKPFDIKLKGGKTNDELKEIEI
ncbi:DUF3302 domain-containing protein [Aureibacter tunicatorum]|uniref:DUF3302 domain-containing protein n=1 Tax=Aureibacter tunicatorum TaxID=866807 RepID=A0AAE3XKZ9_9BACT|nr:DUF3302 domain-containing protein [Aureibacter tunicatorum]MDR6238445.1 hypothetical protein [Aureibacter tunicatorum]BDD05621.1 hypothetical protein AUTU_31040 [Aureibacter tunicatorum]